MKYRKRDYPLDQIRRHLETGPIVLISSARGDRTNVMTLGWHMMLGFDPALVACYIWSENESYALIRESRECVINVPTVDLLDTVVRIGNCHGRDGDKFERFGLTRRRAVHVAAPLIAECYASFECQLHDDGMLDKYGLFIWRVVKAHVAPLKSPRTIHYRGQGEFMIAGAIRSRRAHFITDNL